MSLAPKYAGNLLNGKPVVTLELFLDYVCPFSKKAFDTFHNQVIPYINKNYKNKVEIVFRNVVQPWHPSSTLVHEAALAISHLEPNDTEKFWKFSNALFTNQADYFDEVTINETRIQTYNRLATLANKTIGVDKEKFLNLLVIPSLNQKNKQGEILSVAKNIGNDITVDIKYFTRYHRQIGVHVTPSFAVNGILNNSASSSWGLNDWIEVIEAAL